MSLSISADLSVTLLWPTGGFWAQVCLAGSIDQQAATQLAEVTDQLAGSTVRWAFVDVAGVTFADATLPRFCVRLRCVLPGGSALDVCRPGPMTRQLLTAAARNRILTLCDDLPLLDTSGAMSRAMKARFRARSSLRADGG